MNAAVTAETFRSGELLRTAMAARLAARKRARVLREAVLITLPEAWRETVRPLLDPLELPALSVVLSVLRLMWREGYRIGHSDALRGRHMKPGEAPGGAGH